MSEHSDWELLTDEQQKAVIALRGHMGNMLTAIGDEFYQEHPELQLAWNFTLEPLIRGKHDTLRGTSEKA